MVPGLLIGLQRTTAIDYDAVAYRTAAILTEDRGCLIDTEGKNCIDPLWESKSANTPGQVGRIGLAAGKDTPNILANSKVQKFFNTSFFNMTDYRTKIIFGDYPYKFNISLINETGPVYQPIGDSVPDMGNYGYIKRVVKIRGDSYDILDINETNACDNGYCTKLLQEISNTSQTMNITLNLASLLNESINPSYQYDPRVDRINITINNFNKTLNCNTSFRDNSLDFPYVANNTTWNTKYNLSDCPDNATLKTVWFYLNDQPNALPIDYSNISPYYSLSIDGISGFNLSPSFPVKQNISLIIYPDFELITALNEKSKLDIRFKFQDEYNSTYAASTLIAGSHEIIYDADTFVQGNLSPAWLEVAVW